MIARQARNPDVCILVGRRKFLKLVLSSVWLFATPWTVAHQGPLSMGFPRQECWSGLLFPSLRDLPDPGTEPKSPALADGVFTTKASRKPPYTSKAVSKPLSGVSIISLIPGNFSIKLFFSYILFIFSFMFLFLMDTRYIAEDWISLKFLKGNWT